MKIAVLGVGAMGSLFAACLASVATVTLVGHWQAQLEALRQGLTLIHPDGTQTRHTLEVAAVPRDAAPADIALVLVKSWQTVQAAQEARMLLACSGLAVTLQNGLGNNQKLAAVVGPERVALGVTAQGASLLAPGVVRHGGHGPTYLGTEAATRARVETLATLLNLAGLETQLSDNVAGLAWGKLAVNAGINPLTALLRQPNGYLVENQRARRLMEGAAAEVAAVAAAQQIDLPYSSAAAQALAVAQATAANHSSMLQDVLRGAPTEIEAICGVVVEQGRLYHVATPVNMALQRLVLAQQAPLAIEEIEAAVMATESVAGGVF